MGKFFRAKKSKRGPAISRTPGFVLVKENLELNFKSPSCLWGIGARCDLVGLMGLVFLEITYRNEIVLGLFTAKSVVSFE